MDSAKLKKLQDYSIFLTQQAESKEARGEASEAVKDYVKLVDVLLLLANDAQDHSSWQQLISRAEFYQKKARLIADPSSASHSRVANNSNPYEIKPASQRRNENTLQGKNGNNGSTSILNSFRNLPSSLIGRKSDNTDSSNLSLGPNKVISSWTKELGSGPPNTPTTKQAYPMIDANQETGEMQVTALEARKTEGNKDQVPRSLYSKLLEEKKQIEKELDALRAKEKEYLETIDAKEKQFAETISTMVPKSQFDEIQAKLEDSVPRSEYEQALTISAIPRERYIELQAHVAELEMKLRNSVPKIVLDEIAEYVSFLVSTSMVSDDLNVSQVTSTGDKTN